MTYPTDARYENHTNGSKTSYFLCVVPGPARQVLIGERWRAQGVGAEVEAGAVHAANVVRRCADRFEQVLDFACIQIAQFQTERQLARNEVVSTRLPGTLVSI